MTTRLSAWVHKFDLDQAPKEVVHQARRALLDTIGVACAGARHPVTAKIRNGFATGAGPASVTGGGTGTPETAALVNAAAAHAFDFDDVSHTGIMHGSAVIAPSVLAAMERVGASDSQALEAFIAGSETAYALGDALTHQHYFQGWWPSVTLPVIGASAAVAKIQGGTAEQIGHAIGLATANAGGSRSVIGTDGKPFLLGFSAKTAVEFAAAAGAQVSGPADAFENDNGFISLLNAGVKDLSALETLGEKWRLIEPGLLFKRYPICSSALALTEESAALKVSHGFDPRDVEEVRCEVPDLVARSLVYDDPQSPQQCQFSIPFGVACGINHGGVALEHIASGATISREIRSTMAKVHWTQDPALSIESMRLSYPECAKIAVRLKGQNDVEGFRPLATGMPAKPISDEGLVEKFLACLSFAGISGATANEATETILISDLTPDGFALGRVLRNLWADATGGES